MTRTSNMERLSHRVIMTRSKATVHHNTVNLVRQGVLLKETVVLVRP
jgi:hypothetical protein